MEKLKGTWIAGIFDGLANVIIAEWENKTKVAIRMVIPKQDIEIVEALEKEIGVKATKVNNSESMQIEITTWELIKRLVEKINGTSLHKEIEKLCRAVGIVHKKGVSDKEYLYGYFLGKGSIYIRDAIKIGKTKKLIVTISASENEKVLEELRKYILGAKILDSQNGKANLRINIYEKAAVMGLREILMEYPIIASKMKRIVLAEEFYELKKEKLAKEIYKEWIEYIIRFDETEKYIKELRDSKKNL